MRRALLVMVLAAVVALAVGYALASRLPRQTAPPPAADPALVVDGRNEPVRRIRATLFYVSEDGMRLVGADREVPYAERPADQARFIVEELLKPAPAPFASALPADTSLRAVFVTDQGDAFVDLNAVATTGHTGGSLDELFSVYAVVNSITVNLPAIQRVQLLVDGKEVDTLAGHVDIREPLGKNLKWVQAPEPAPAPATQ